MLRPTSSSGEYGRTPWTRSIVDSIVNSGMICTRPPIDTVIRVRMASRMTLRSRVAWRKNMALLRRERAQMRGLDLGQGEVDAGRGLPQVPDHAQRAGGVEHAAEHADQVEGMHRGDGLDERVLQEAELVVGPPHQALHDTRHPHRGDVEHDAEGRDPEVPGDGAGRIQR